MVIFRVILVIFGVFFGGGVLDFWGCSAAGGSSRSGGFGEVKFGVGVGWGEGSEVGFFEVDF